MRIAVNDAAALRAGVLPGDARRAASTLVSGLTVGNFFQQQAVFDVVVRGTPAVRSDPQGVRNLLLDTSGGRHVRLRNIARVGLETAPVDIEHQALSRYVDVAAPVSGRSADSAATAVHRRLATVGFPLEYHAEVLGSTPEDATSHAAFLSYLAAVVVGVLLLLQAAFASWRLALLVTLMLPLTLAGGVIVGFALGKQASLGMVAGLLGVFAVAARHGMLLVAGVRREHSSDGGTLSRALVVRAASTGLATTAGGTLAIAALLLPFVVMGDVAGNELTGVAAAVMLGGLASAALANLLALPSLCLAFGPAQPAMLEDESESERLGPYRRVHPGRRATDAPPV
jgi:Cu/Ag efflux pump CusA